MLAISASCSSVGNLFVDELVHMKCFRVEGIIF